MEEREEYLTKLCAFLKTQDYVQSEIGIEALRAARRRDEIGITSLGVIMLVANYMEQSGIPNVEFNPDWIEHFDYVDGIVSTLREIDLAKAQRAGR
jgi:hypothetical protein